MSLWQQLALGGERGRGSPVLFFAVVAVDIMAVLIASWLDLDIRRLACTEFRDVSPYLPIEYRMSHHSFVRQRISVGLEGENDHPMRTPSPSIRPHKMTRTPSSKDPHRIPTICGKKSHCCLESTAKRYLQRNSFTCLPSPHYQRRPPRDNRDAA